MDPNILEITKQIVIDVVCACDKDLAGNDFLSEVACPSGVVFAGFGEEECYPRCHSYDVGAVLFEKTMRRESYKCDISTAHVASIQPFAQQDVIQSFLAGVSRRIWNTIEKSLEEYIGENGTLLTEVMYHFYI